MKILKTPLNFTDFLPASSSPTLKSYILPDNRAAKKTSKVVALNHADLRRAVGKFPVTRGLQRTSEALIAFRKASQTAHIAGKFATYAVGLLGAVPGAAVGIALSPLGILVGLLTRDPGKSRFQAAVQGAAVTIGIFAGLSAVPSYALACVLTWSGLQAVVKLASIPLNVAVKKTGLHTFLADLDDERSLNKKSALKD